MLSIIEMLECSNQILQYLAMCLEQWPFCSEQTVGQVERRAGERVGGHMSPSSISFCKIMFASNGLLLGSIIFTNRNVVCLKQLILVYSLNM